MNQSNIRNMPLNSSIGPHTTQSQFHSFVPPEFKYSQEERNGKLQIQNFKVYQELRKKMEVSI